MIIVPVKTEIITVNVPVYDPTNPERFMMILTQKTVRTPERELTEEEYSTVIKTDINNENYIYYQEGDI